MAVYTVWANRFGNTHSFRVHDAPEWITHPVHRVNPDGCEQDHGFSRPDRMEARYSKGKTFPHDPGMGAGSQVSYDTPHSLFGRDGRRT